MLVYALTDVYRLDKARHNLRTLFRQIYTYFRNPNVLGPRSPVYSVAKLFSVRR